MSDSKWLEKQKHFDWMQKSLTCWKLCEEFILWSIEEGKYLDSINICRDATEVCNQCIKFEAQRSPFFRQLCEVGAEICEACAEQLKKHLDEDEIFRTTMDACRTFATACREIAKQEINESVGSMVRKKQNTRP